MNSARNVAVLTVSLLLQILPAFAQQKPSELQAGVTSSLENQAAVIQPKQEDRSSFPLKDAQNVLFVLDVSVAAKKKFQINAQQSRLDKAKELIEATLNAIPKGVRSGLRVYGTEDIPTQEGRNTALLTPLDLNNKRKVLGELRTISTGSNVWLTYALKQAFENDLLKVNGNSVIIVLPSANDSAVFLDALQYVERCAKRGTIPAKVVILDLNEQNERIGKDTDSMRKNPSSARILRSGVMRANVHSCLLGIAAATNGEYYGATRFNWFFKDIVGKREEAAR